MADDVRRAEKPDLSELGTSGSRLLSGILYEEYNPDLASGIKAFNKYNEMRFDATCAAGYKAIELPIRSAEHFIEPFSEDPKDVDKADFIHHNLFNFGTQSMDDCLRLSFTMLVFGFSWMEIIYAMIESGDYAGKVGWDRFAWRSPLTKWRWNMGEVNGRQELMSVTQLAPPYYTQIDIPRNKLLLFSHQQEGDNYDGFSLFRPAYKNYFYRDLLYKVQAIGLERSYMGIPVMKLKGAFSAEMKTLALKIVEGLRTDENVGVTLPDDELALEIIQNKLGAGQEMQAAINYHDRQILKSMLAQWLDLGSAGAAGSWSLSSDHSEMFLYALNAEANYQDETFNLNPGIPQLIRFNYPDAQEDKMPKLTHGEIGQRSLETLGRTLAALGQWGFVTPDDATEDAFRQMLDLPERDNTMTPEALKSLITTIFPSQLAPGRKHQGPPRPMSPAQMKAQGATPAAPAGTPPAPGQPDANGQTTDENAANFAEKYAIVQDAMRRAPWRKPKGRIDAVTRLQAQAAEQFGAALQHFREPAKAPELPSIRAARLRRPYEMHDVGMEEVITIVDEVKAAEKSSIAATIASVKERRDSGNLGLVPLEKRKRNNVASLHAGMLAKESTKIETLLRGLPSRTP